MNKREIRVVVERIPKVAGLGSSCTTGRKMIAFINKEIKNRKRDIKESTHLLVIGKKHNAPLETSNSSRQDFAKRVLLCTIPSRIDVNEEL